MHRMVLDALIISIAAAVTSSALPIGAQAKPASVPWYCRRAGACKCHEICTYDGRTTTCRFICQPRTVTERSARPAGTRRSPVIRSPTRAPEPVRHRR